MSRIVTFLRRNAFLGVACIVVLWPLIAVILVLLLTVPALAVFPLAASAFVLWIFFGVRSLWRQRRRVTSVLLASVLVVPYGLLHVLIVDRSIRGRAESIAQSRAVRSFQERLAADGQVAVSDVVTGWDSVCACTMAEDPPFYDCYVGYGPVRGEWQLKFYRHPDGNRRSEQYFLEVKMPGLANVSFDRTVCYTADQAPLVSRDPLYDDLLALTARPPTEARPK